MNMRHTSITLSVCFALLVAVVAAASHSPAQNAYTSPFPAFRITQNLYYVGSKESASYLVATPRGSDCAKAGAPAAFIDPQGYKDYVSEREQAFRKELATQQADGGK